jgi:hypothetical protein
VIGGDEKVNREKFVGMAACGVAKDIRTARRIEKAAVGDPNGRRQGMIEEQNLTRVLPSASKAEGMRAPKA